MAKTHTKVSIIMYHYVRDLKHTRYPDIKGLDTALFEAQIEYLKKHYYFITMESLIDAVENNTKLPEKSVLLTFDDGYSDHFKYVFPLLNKHKIQGSFFVPVKTITEHTVLDVNKIHFILASEKNESKLIAEIKSQLKIYRKDFNLESNEFYYQKLAHANRFDTAGTIFIKRLLQVELNESLRGIITNNLFEKIVCVDEETFSRELYLDMEQLQCMQRNGMHIGSHCYNHYWLGSLNRQDQQTEIEKSIEFLTGIGCNTQQWTMCYPYGDYNNDTLSLLDEFNCKLAVTTNVNVADLSQHNKFTLPRLDTNDLPKSNEAGTNCWYLKG